MVSEPAHAKPEPFMLTVDQLAQRLQMSPNTVYELARDGTIPCVRFSRKLIRFDPEVVEKIKRGELLPGGKKALKPESKLRHFITRSKVD